MLYRSDFDIVIIGAGISGLSAAFYSRSMSQERGTPARILLLEASSRAGGKIRTETEEIGKETPFLMEWGADSMLSTKAEGLDLANDLGLRSELIETQLERQIYMLKQGRMVAMPEGLQLIIPKRLWPFLKSPLFSWPGKMQMALDLAKPRHRSGDDESIGSFVRRRLGQEALDLLAEPILSGIYSSDPERQSLRATFPQLAKLEGNHRSLILGALKSSQALSTGLQRQSLFVSFKNGMQTLIDALCKSLASEIRLNTAVEGVHREESGAWRIRLSHGETLTSKRLIVTSPAPSTASIISGVAPEAASHLRQMRQTSSGCAYLAYARQEVPHPLRGYGILVPKVENRQINAVTWVSSKMNGRAPASHVLFRVFFGGERHPEMMLRDDNDILTIAHREIADLHGIHAEPTMSRVFRAEDGNPQYDVGHLDKINRIEKSLPPGLIVTGCAMRGIGIPDCIRQGKQAATESGLLPNH